MSATVAVSARRTSRRLRLAWVLVRDIRSPEWGLAGQGVRFVLSGCLVAAVYVTTTTVLYDLFAVAFQLALAVGFVASIALHFTLQRMFVWRHRQGFALQPHHQLIRYVLMCAVVYGLTALSTSQLPSLLGLPVEAVYLTTLLSIAGVNFVVFRGHIFHAVAAEGQKP